MCQCVVMCVQSHANVDNVIQGIKICDYHLLLKIDMLYHPSG